MRDSGVDDDGRPFVVMDFVEGQSLAARLRDGVLSVPAAIRLGATLADALAHVHARRIVHRDVKPGNVLLDGEGRPQLTDFGIARLVDATRVTATGLVVGTAAYMAPEQVRGEVVGPADAASRAGAAAAEGGHGPPRDRGRRAGVGDRPAAPRPGRPPGDPQAAGLGDPADDGDGSGAAPGCLRVSRPSCGHVRPWPAARSRALWPGG